MSYGKLCQKDIKSYFKRQPSEKTDRNRNLLCIDTFKPKHKSLPRRSAVARETESASSARFGE